MKKKIKIKIQLHLLKRTMYKEHKMMEEVAHGLCDNYVKPRRPGVYQTLTLIHHLPWTVISAKAGGITVNFASTYHYYFPDSSVSHFTVIIFCSNIQLQYLIWGDSRKVEERFQDADSLVNNP